ncbi:MAG: HAD family hydrolase [Phycisphaerales bacterium]|nr:HAD family hydrolase [Phycisphaerales bacterium]
MPNPPIDALFLDFYGTISADDHAAVEEACRGVVEALKLPMSAGQFAVRWGEVFFRTIEHANHDRFATLHECECASLVETLRGFDIHEIDPEPFVAVLKRYWQNPPLHADAVELLRRIDVPVCCVSNADREDIESAIALHGLRFDAFITSQCARAYKPEEAIFHGALKMMGVLPSRVMHVGDSLHSDVGGAQRLGIRTTWICRDKRIHDIGRHEPDHTIRSLDELPALLASLA